MKNFTTFEELLQQAPEEVQRLIDELKTIRERPDYHPEENALLHVKIVTERLMQTGDMDLIISGLFHDIGKKVLNRTSDKTGFPTAPGHDKFGAEKVMKHKKWVEEMGADPEMVAEICAQHMRVKQIANMKTEKQKELQSMKCWDKLQVFTAADDMLQKFSI